MAYKRDRAASRALRTLMLVHATNLDAQAHWTFLEYAGLTEREFGRWLKDGKLSERWIELTRGASPNVPAQPDAAREVRSAPVPDGVPN